ncbi:MAG: serine/threonine protein phosphatase [Gammaproteobacteria bacterium]|nr:serine/threonine protein phosphatase [Gammaproteobacteria bacterium]
MAMTGTSGGAPPSVPAGSVVYAIGDIHGEAAKLDRLHAMIRADADSRASNRRIAIYLGDYVDRGPDSAGVVDRLVADTLPGFARVFLMGNHEDFLLQFLEAAGSMSAWFYNGGLRTLESYDVDVRAHDAWMADPQALQDEFLSRLPQAHREFFAALDLYRVEGDYLFVHAGIRPGRRLADQSRADLLWIREAFIHSDADHGHIVVHGHTPREAVEVRRNRIGIDTGAVYGGKLTALVLEGEGREFLQA